MKKILLLRFIAIIMLFAVSSLTWAYDAEINGIYYNFSGDEATVTYYSNRYDNKTAYSGSIVIPNTVTLNSKTYTVTSIDAITFQGCTGLWSITVPNSVTSIGWAAFSGCTSLRSITIPNSVTSIEDSAFSGCSGLNKADFASVESLCKISFGNYSANPLYYAKRLYINKQEVTDLVIPNNVTSIGNDVFRNCSGLTSVTIPNSVTSIGERAFEGCSGLTSVTIGNSVTSIGNSAFSGCSGLTSVTIGNSVTIIGNYAFSGCTSLTSITIPNSVTSIGWGAFRSCTSLTSITIPNSVTSIEDSAFSGCSGLTSITIPNSVTSIGSYAFNNCIGLTSVTIPNSVTSIDEYAFRGCSGLTSVTIPENLTTIGSNAFSGCSGLKSLTLNSNNIASKTYTSSSNLGSVFGTQVEECIFGDKITSIGDYAFYNCSGLTSVTIPNSVTSIGRSAFYGCSGLTSIIIPDEVTTISFSSFPNSTKKYVNKGSLALLAAWKSGIIPYDLTTDISLEKPTIKYSSTQTTVTANVSPIYDEYVYCINNIFYIESEDDKVTFDGLIPGRSKAIQLQISLGEFSFSSTYDASTQDLEQQVLPVSRSASSFKVKASYTKGDAEVLGESLTVNGITQDGNTAIFTGLRPQRTYYVKYNVTVKHGDVTYTCSQEFDISTEALTLTTSQPKVISVGNAVVGAISNLDDAEENVGFEWRRTDWTDDFASNTGAAYLYEGTMEGYIRNLYTEKLWKVRPYYKSNDGKFYYGEWVGLDPTNTSYFEPTVHTYARIDQTENKVQISGYVQRGTDDVSKQGFKYWVQEDNARGAGISIPSGAKTIEAEGRVMEVELTGLKPNTTYAYVAFITTTEGETFYGKQLSFTTGDDPEASVTGDANGNGEVEIGDVTSVLTLMATPEATGYNNKAADANGNGVIEIGDVTTILTIMAGN